MEDLFKDKYYKFSYNDNYNYDGLTREGIIHIGSVQGNKEHRMVQGDAYYVEKSNRICPRSRIIFDNDFRIFTDCLTEETDRRNWETNILDYVNRFKQPI